MTHPNDSTRFWNQVAVALPDECWEWKAARSPLGYGRTFYGGRVMLAHRVAWIEETGAIPDGLKICHRCDNPPCCNPSHLFLGTQRDNIHDMIRKGRAPKEKNWATGDRSPARLHPDTRADQRGSLNAASKLTEQEVRTMRIERANGALISSIAHRYGVSTGTVSMIVNRVTWKHLIDQ